MYYTYLNKFITTRETLLHDSIEIEYIAFVSNEIDMIKNQLQKSMSKFIKDDDFRLSLAAIKETSSNYQNLNESA